MKKRYLIGATVIALILSISAFFVSVYAAVKQTISVSNQITFAGNQNAKSFLVKGQISGTINDSNPNLRMEWEYDYENQIGLDGFNWNLGDLQFDSSSGNLNEIGITYTFTISNQNDKTIMAEFVGPNDLPSGLNKTFYAYNQESSPVEGSNITFGSYETVVLELKLTISDLDYYCKQAPVNFSINIDVAE